MRALFLLFLTLSSCSLQQGDCRYFDEPCLSFVPQGLECGLANTFADHLGGSCLGEYDPALYHGNQENESATDNHQASCPDGFVMQSISDHEVSSQWMFCDAHGRAGNTGAGLGDIPAGAVCGLSVVPTNLDHTCMGMHSIKGECPPGFRFRWVPDSFYDLLGADYHADPKGKLTAGADIVTFCEPVEDEGCTEGNCPDYLDRRGLLCGLHARDLGEMNNINQSTIRDISLILESFLRPASAWYPEIADILPQVEDAVYGDDAEPRCMGRPVAEGCPAGLGLVCTADWFSTTYYAPFALCWCDDPESAQSL